MLHTAVLVFCVVGTGCGSRTFEDGFEGPDHLEVMWQIDAHDSCFMEKAADRPREGDLALRVHGPEGLRCEVVPRIYSGLRAKFRREPFGRKRWYRFSVFVEDLGEVRESKDLGDNTLVAQWHSSPDRLLRKEGGRGPPLALRIIDGKWGITYGWDKKFRSDARYLAKNWHWIGPVETGRWIDWTFGVLWSYEDDGITEVWRDSELVMERKGPNVFNDLRGVYMKLGLYHPTSDQTIILDRISITD